MSAKLLASVEESAPDESANPAPERKAAALDDAVGQLEQAPDYAKVRYQTQVFRLATDLMATLEGMYTVLERVPRLVRAGAFHGGPWDDPSKLLPHLVGIGLKGEGVYPSIEALSELRMVAIATDRMQDERIDADQAATFLREACAQNLDLMFPDASEESRIRPGVFDRAGRLFELICNEISVEGLMQTVVDEIELICAQRPIVTRRVLRLLDQAGRLTAEEDGQATQERLRRYTLAAGTTTALAAQAGTLTGYRRALHEMDEASLVDEARTFAAALTETGLGSPYHAVLLRWLARGSSEQLGLALGLNEAGLVNLKDNQELACQLIRVGLFPDTNYAILGLHSLLERGLLSRSEVAAGLRRLINIDVLPEVQARLLALCPPDAGITANSILLAGSLSMLGQPLGIGQGNNPACQAARGLSLWSQHAPGLLLSMLATAVRDGFVRLDFEGQVLRTDELLDSGQTHDLDLDPVSAVLVPHLDRLYARLLQLAAGRSEDPHKWVNPAMYGRWVPSGFASAFHPVTGAVVDHEAFVRRFYATHHPEYNDRYELVYPNPVGLMVTDVHANMLGPHAVSIQRIARAPDGELRVYFFNPNNEGRQRWGHGVVPAVVGHAEIPGESSLPLDQFVSRLYAFHFDPYEEGEAYAVPADLVRRVSQMARDSWGRACTWLE